MSAVNVHLKIGFYHESGSRGGERDGAARLGFSERCYGAQQKSVRANKKKAVKARLTGSERVDLHHCGIQFWQRTVKGICRTPIRSHSAHAQSAVPRRRRHSGTLAREKKAPTQLGDSI